MKSRSSFVYALLPLLTADRPLVGGQAVMEGVMMRNGPSYGLAVRQNGTICAERRGWYSFLPKSINSKPFIRGVPVLIETLVNGIKSLNRSAELQGEADDKPLEGWHLVLTLLVSFAFALGLFLLLPHALSWGMQQLHLGGDVSGVSFQLWDGFFKMLILIGYIWGIGRVPEIHRVFQYHGAEHKTIRAFETGLPVDVDLAARQIRMHPRCGTTLLLFVICISILIHAVFVPLLLYCYTPESAVLKHLMTIAFKILLVFPTASLAYEIIRFAGRMKDGWFATLLRAPGMALQLLTTEEPDRDQLAVAIVALREALGPDSGYEITTGDYRLL